ncbi:dTDP-4-amino-4,6-dideoxy-D-glucose acetyltransferase VioB [Enteractinococcus fodinae]|uniref:Sugar O-acyltransferase (Sialic acid O-acetyltransferase NeuD family) n=1 Tax=Enteractinococcus fodinae TaxID=684663 RepID=A0ABU2B336_9MICC|nr:NeuD/PglB/VioB family sugar acetyltransferase [Enteractinococcus fodinae]MDR7348000.1 sugar O-acyltransferase (sialic acid O-acetyltransferase NeuD family) [Enteractinococcus fodinae]
MSLRLVIVGAGGFGRAVYEWVGLSPKHCQDTGIAEVVFIDDNPGPITPQASVIDTVGNYIPERNDVLLIAVGSPRAKMEIVANLEERDVKYHTFVADQAVVAPSAVIGAGVVICPGVVIDPDVIIDNHSHLNKNCSVGHDSRLGEYSTLSPLVNVMGGVTLGRKAFVGGSAAILPSLRIEDGSVVGAGAVVTRDVGAGTTVVGNPAKALVRPKSPAGT